MFVVGKEGFSMRDAKMAIKDVEFKISPSCLEKVEKSYNNCQLLAGSEKSVYGVNTGFGELAKVKILSEETALLQENLIRSHDVGVGEYTPYPIAKLATIIRLHTLSKGFSGVSLATLEFLRDLLDTGLVPAIPKWGSVGASGDLAPLAAMAMLLLGEGKVMYPDGRIEDAAVALKKFGLRSKRLEAKEGLALINGTSFTTAIASYTYLLHSLLVLLSAVGNALSFEAMRGHIKALEDRVLAVRKQSGQLEWARLLRVLLNGSDQIIKLAVSPYVQDPYSMRCSPIVAGASLDQMLLQKKILENEMDSVTDNPIIFEDDAISGGNFHAEPIGFAAEGLKLAASELASIAERRMYLLLDPAKNRGLSAFLAPKSGLNSGFMIVQYAAASLVAQNKVLSHPAVVDTIPTSAGQEDHVSMANASAWNYYEVVKNSIYVSAMEIATALQAVFLRKREGLRPSDFALKLAEVLEFEVVETDFEVREWIEHVFDSIPEIVGLVREVVEDEAISDEIRETFELAWEKPNFDYRA